MHSLCGYLNFTNCSVYVYLVFHLKCTEWQIYVANNAYMYFSISWQQQQFIPYFEEYALCRVGLECAYIQPRSSGTHNDTYILLAAAHCTLAYIFVSI